MKLGKMKNLFWVVGVILDMRKLGEEVVLELESEINVFVSDKF